MRKFMVFKVFKVKANIKVKTIYAWRYWLNAI